MKKRKLREWEIPMNFSQEEKKEFNITTEDQINWHARKIKTTHNYEEKKVK